MDKENMFYVHNGLLFLKNEEAQSFALTQKILEDIMLNETSLA